MCSPHGISKSREHRKLVPKDKWNEVDADIYYLQLLFSDVLFQNSAAYLKYNSVRQINKKMLQNLTKKKNS